VTAPRKVAGTDLETALRLQMKRHPYGTVAIAAGVGYLLGSRLGAPLVALFSSRIGVELTSSLLAPLLKSPGASARASPG